jgi:hypothetical protein
MVRAGARFCSHHAATLAPTNPTTATARCNFFISQALRALSAL